MSRVRRWIGFIVPLCVLAAALLFDVATGTVESGRLKLFDRLQRASPRIYQPAPVRVVDIDDRSLEAIGQWPWPRNRTADLVDRLAQLGAVAIVFDIVFAEPDRTSPATMLGNLPPQVIERLGPSGIAVFPDHDRILSQSIAAAPVVTGFALLDEPRGDQPAALGIRRPARKAGVAVVQRNDVLSPVGFAAAVLNLPMLEQAATGNGSFTVFADGDGMHRRVPLIFRHVASGELYPALSLEAVRVFAGASAYVIDDAGIRIGNRTVPIDGRGRMWLHDTGPVPDRFVSAVSVLHSRVEPSLIDGHIVLVGTSATGLKDLRPTPLASAVPGVTIHAQLIEQILLGDFLERPAWAHGAEIVYMILVTVLAIALSRRLGVLGGLGLLAICALAWGGFSFHAYVRLHILLDPLLASVAALTAYVAASIAEQLFNEVEKGRIRRAFSRYLSPDVVERLAQQPDRLRLGGEMRDMTVMFCDLRGFTDLSERLDPEELTRLINRFLTSMTDVILDHGGTIDKYIGDCVMAFWNAPLDDPDHARHACDAALEMVMRLRHLNRELLDEARQNGRPFSTIRAGIGINTGRCCVGNMGSDRRFDYSVVGAEVNLAARLEEVTKTFGIDIVIGDRTRAGLAGHAVLDLGAVTVRGREEPVHAHALLGGVGLGDDPAFQALQARHEAVLEAIRNRRLAEITHLTEDCIRLRPDLAPLYHALGAQMTRGD